MFESSPKLKELSYKITVATSKAVGSGAHVRLLKLETPKFDGILLKWRVFWEHLNLKSLCMSETYLTAVYLQSSLKDGTAKGVIEGFVEVR